MTVTAREKESEKKKRGIEGEGDLISLHQGPTADKEILFWRKIGFAQYNVCSLTLAWTAQVLTQWVRVRVSVRNPLWPTNKTIVSMLVANTSSSSSESIYVSLQEWCKLQTPTEQTCDMHKSTQRHTRNTHLFLTPKADGLQCHRLDGFSAPCPARRPLPCA